VKKSKTLLLVVLVVAVAAASLLEGASRSPRSISDCSYLITILEKALNYALDFNYRGEYIARVMLNTPVDPKLQDLHRKAYRAVLDYYAIINSTRASLDDLRELLGELDAIGSYASSLQRCSREPGVVVIATRITRYLLPSLKSRVEDLVKHYSEMLGLVLVNVPERVFEPGDQVLVKVYVNDTCSAISALLLYKDTILESVNFTCSSSNCSAVLSIPPASSMQGITGSATVKFTVVVRATCGGRELRVYRFIEAKYATPRVTIDAPPTTTRGDLLAVTVNTTSGLVLAGVLLVKNTVGEFPLLSSIVINSTPTTYYFRVDKPFIVGVNALKLCVNASEKTLPYCFEKAIIVQPRHPRVSVRTTTTSITWVGEIPVYITSESGEYTVQVYLNGVLVAESRVSSTETITINSGVLPLSVLSLRVIIRDPSGEYDDYVYSAVITSINMASLLLVLFAGSLATLALREHEKLFVLSLRTSSTLATRRVKREVARVLEEFLKPYTHKLKSHVLELYYTILTRLGVRLPHHYETLREHYSLVVKSVIKKSSVREALWKIVRLAERDLYSRKKPHLREAEELYEGVLSAIEEET
jgi:hypothetical protein